MHQLTVLPKHYPIVGKYFLLAIDEFLGGTSDPSMLNVWSIVYKMIADIFINIEKKLYNQLGAKNEQGFLPFTILEKEIIANGPIVAFTFERSDGKPLLQYHSGQYITLRIKKDGHYSLVHPFDGKTYRIAMKQEFDHELKGIVSNEMINHSKVGDIVSISLPAGSYTFINNARDYLFIAGGIGITVLVSMILDLHQQNKSDRITLIHSVIKEDQAAFSDQMRAILPENRFHLLVQSKHLLQGVIRQSIKPETQVYLCGSVVFMNKSQEYLAQCGHPSTQIHVEAYQPSLSLLQDAVKNQSNLVLWYHYCNK